MKGGGQMRCCNSRHAESMVGPMQCNAHSAERKREKTHA